MSSHEAKLAAVAAAEAPLKAELASLQARLDASEAEVTAVREEGRATMVQLAMDAAAKRYVGVRFVEKIVDERG